MASQQRRPLCRLPRSAAARALVRGRSSNSSQERPPTCSATSLLYGIIAAAKTAWSLQSERLIRPSSSRLGAGGLALRNRSASLADGTRRAPMALLTSTASPASRWRCAISHRIGRFLRARLRGASEYYRDAASAQVLGPGPHDVLAFDARPGARRQGGRPPSPFRLPADPSPGDRGRAAPRSRRPVGRSEAQRYRPFRRGRCPSPSSRIRTATRSSSGRSATPPPCAQMR